MRVVRSIPPDQIGWTRRPVQWTLGDLCRHIALVGSQTFGEGVQNRPSAYKGFRREHGSTLDDVIGLMEKLHRETVAVIAQFSDTDLVAKCPSAQGIPVARWKLPRAMTEHEIHHRGQL